MSGYHVEWNHKAPKIGGEGNATAENQVATPTTNSVEENNVVLVPTQSIAAEEVSVNTSATPIVNEMPSSVKTNSNKTSFHKENTKDKVLSENSSYTVAPNKTQTVNESPSVAQNFCPIAVGVPQFTVYDKEPDGCAPDAISKTIASAFGESVTINSTQFVPPEQHAPARPTLELSQILSALELKFTVNFGVLLLH